MNIIDVKDVATWPNGDQYLWSFSCSLCTKHVGQEIRDDIYSLKGKAFYKYEGMAWLPCDERGWISVEDGLLFDDRDVIGWWNCFSACKYIGEQWFDEEGLVWDPKFWMPGPPSPLASKGLNKKGC